GADPFGQQARDNLRHQGINTDSVRPDPHHPTGTAFILVDDDAQNRIIVVPGANTALSPADVRAAAGAICSAALVLCQLEVPLAPATTPAPPPPPAAVRPAPTPPPPLPLPDALPALAALCAPNETELEALAGPAPSELAAAQRLRRRTGGPVLVTLGSRGALL